MKGCEQVESFLASADGAARRNPPPELRAHLDKCGPCRELFEFATTEESSAVRTETRCAIQRALAASLHPVRPLPCRTTRTVLFVSIFAIGAGLWVFKTGWNGAAGQSSIQIAGSLAAVAAAAVLASALLSAEMAPGEGRPASIGFVVAAAVGGMAALIAALFPWEAAGPDWMAPAMKCHVHGALFAIPVAAAALVALRRGAPMCPASAGAGVGLLAGLAAMATLELGCARHDALHIAAGHLSIPAGAALIGFLIGKAVERRSHGRRRSLEA